MSRTLPETLDPTGEDPRAHSYSHSGRIALAAAIAAVDDSADTARALGAAAPRGRGCRHRPRQAYGQRHQPGSIAREDQAKAVHASKDGQPLLVGAGGDRLLPLRASSRNRRPARQHGQQQLARRRRADGRSVACVRASTALCWLLPLLVVGRLTIAATVIGPHSCAQSLLTCSAMQPPDHVAFHGVHHSESEGDPPRWTAQAGMAAASAVIGQLWDRDWGGPMNPDDFLVRRSPCRGCCWRSNGTTSVRDPASPGQH